MKLDSRIIEGKKPLDCFDTEQAKQFLGKECYFSDHLCTFNKLLDAYSYVTADILVSKEKHLYVGELLTVGDSDESCYEAGINGEAEWFQFCLPCEWVKEPEKKYRPYKNVQELFEDIGVYIGDFIHFRSKAKETEDHALITSYTTLKNGTEKICLGGAYYYTMQALFDLFELRSHGDWQPFGIEDK